MKEGVAFDLEAAVIANIYLFDIPFIIILDHQIFFVQLEIVPNNLEPPCKICINVRCSKINFEIYRGLIIKF